MFANREIYEFIYTNGVSIIKGDAEKRDKEINSVIFEFIKKNKLVYDKSEKTLIIFVDNLKKRAYELKKEIKDLDDFTTGMLFQNINSAEITSNGIIVVKLQGSPKNTFDFIRDDAEDSRVPPEMEIINVFHQLYSLSAFENWEDLELKKEELYSKTIKNYERKKNEIHGGKSMDSYAIRKKIFENLLDKESCIVLDHHALCLKEGKKIDHGRKIRVITDDVAKLVNYLMGEMDNSTTKKQCSYTIDPSLHKTTLYINNAPVLDIFNCAEYELIPYEKIDNYMVGNKYVLLRFIYIEVWVAVVIQKLGLIDQRIKAIIIQQYLDDIDIVNKYEVINENYFGIHYPSKVNDLKYNSGQYVPQF